MTKKQFIELFGEEPVDVLGQDWENEITDAEESEVREWVRIEKSDDGE